MKAISARALWVAACCLAVAPAAAQPAIGPDEGRPQILWQEARTMVGRSAMVAGKVINVRRLGRITFINFDDQRPRRFEAVIFEDNLANFPKPPEEMYNGQIINIRGRVSLFQDRPQIVITSPQQIEILDALPTSSTRPRPERQVKPGELVIGAYNILNLFDEHDDPYRDDEGTPPKPREQMEKVAETIESINADVLGLVEVENRDYLERFVDVFLPHMGYEHVVLFEGNDGRGIDVALLSRIPVGPVRSHRHLRFPSPTGDTLRFSRDVLAVTLEPPGGKPFEAWIVHLKSKSGGQEFTEPVRLAEAAEIRRLLDVELAADPERRIIVMGDFNDTPESATIETIIGGGPTALWSVHADMGGVVVATYNTGEHKSMIDFILCTPAMRERYVPGTFQVPQGSIETTGSDHNPVVATFRMD
ncbi:MAG TPA: endonuclease/exonuclease/phosphatase family protein [Lacipirellulaceae bacterium]|nr:endonuclease/exonuclease/phosphatase family protein [Lacipirellulaceae bacterium]